ncbi:hypothetical protein Arno162_114 [Pectobacterium phage Arno162]|uniref:Uncharacterized protein n=1 Tax=Pectobacterium phage Arno162 TaxID=2500577 RepID=A0A678ZJW0_9CAUD|nr:hypothetical protein Arno162_114 [Pectobacterium phage Arno162]
MTQLIILMTGEARSGKDTSANLLAEKCKKAGFSVVTTYFAKTLKDSVKNIFELTDEHVFGELKEVPFSMRLSANRIYRMTEHELNFGSLMAIRRNLPYIDTQTIANAITVRMIRAIRENAKRTLWNRLLNRDIYQVSPRQLLQWWGTEAVRKGAYENAWVDCAKFDIEHSGADVAIVSDARFDNEVEQIHSHFPLPIITLTIKVMRGNKVKVSSHISEAGISDRLVNMSIQNDGSLEELEIALERPLKAFL